MRTVPIPSEKELKILLTIQEVTKIPVTDIISRSRKKEHVDARRIYMTILNIYLDIDLAETGRACCGGRQLCSDQNYKQRNFFVNNTFTDWYCSVDKFFLYIKQVDNEVYVNKDCGINYQNQNGPIGSLKNTQLLLEQIGKTPIIKCINKRCFCGLCAPKAVDLDTYNSIMKKYQL